MNMAMDAPPGLSLDESSNEQQLPCNMTFSYTQLDYGIYVWLSGMTAGPPATINAPQLITPGYNPAAFFNGWSLGGQYGAYAMAFLGEKDGVPTIFLKGWVTDISTSEGEFHYIDYHFPLSQ